MGVWGLPSSIISFWFVLKRGIKVRRDTESERERDRERNVEQIKFPFRSRFDVSVWRTISGGWQELLNPRVIYAWVFPSPLLSHKEGVMEDNISEPFFFLFFFAASVSPFGSKSPPNLARSKCFFWGVCLLREGTRSLWEAVECIHDFLTNQWPPGTPSKGWRGAGTKG